MNSIKVPLNEGESEERAGGACAKRPFLFKTGLGRKSPHGPLKTSYGKLAFTLVELIVVIVILGVITTVGFLAFQNYPKQARDVVRISNTKEIEKAIEFYKINDGDYPIPTNYTTGTIDGFSGTWYIGSFGEELANQIQEITKTPLDPKTKTGYYYALREDKMNYRIIADLEETGKKYIVANMIKTPFTPPTIIGNDTIGRSYSNNTYASSCNEYKNPTNTNYSYSGSIGDGVYLIQPIPSETHFQVYCDMTTENGGWTLLASKADDGNNYWTWNNQQVLYNGGITGNMNNLNQDFQSPAWSKVTGNEIMLSNTTKSKYLVYNSIINNEFLSSKYTNANIESPEYEANIKHGTWWADPTCDPTKKMYMKTAAPDSDGNGWTEGSKGFIFRSRYNDGCNYDETMGGLNHSYPGHTHLEWKWTSRAVNGFYNKNFDNDALVVWVR